MFDVNANACFKSVMCSVCAEQHYADEPCPRCTAGFYEACMERLEAAMRREAALRRWIVHHLIVTGGKLDGVPGADG